MDHSEIITQHRRELKQMIDLEYSDLWDTLVSYDVLNQAAADRMKSKFTVHLDQVDELLKYITKACQQTYLKFRKALKDTNQHHIVEKWLPICYPEMDTGQGLVSRSQSPVEFVSRHAEGVVVVQSDVLPGDDPVPSTSGVSTRRKRKPEADGQADAAQKEELQTASGISPPKVRRTVSNRTTSECSLSDETEVEVTYCSPELHLTKKETDPISYTRPQLAKGKVEKLSQHPDVKDITVLRMWMINICPCEKELFDFIFNRCQSLTNLWMYNVKGGKDSLALELSKCLKQMKDLHDIDIRETNFGDSVDEILKSLMNHQMKQFIFSTISLYQSTQSLSSCISKWDTLRWLELVNAEIGPEQIDEVLGGLIKSKAQLLGLNLWGNQIGDSSLPKCVGLLSQLNVLIVGSCNLSGEELIETVEKVPSTIMALDISHNTMKKRHLEQLYPLLKKRFLKYLRLSKGQLGAEREKVTMLAEQKRFHLIIQDHKDRLWQNYNTYLAGIRTRV